MSSRLEQFVQDHRREFDGDEPDPKIWNRINDEINPKKKSGRVFRLNRFQWSAAAAVVILIGGSILYMNLNNETKPPVKGTASETPSATQNDIIQDINPTYAKEVYHFTQLIELKQAEIRQIEKDDPELYKQFMDDINKLDSSYMKLKGELPSNPNREQLLEAMIQNLQLQTDLLNQQLQIIQKIKQSKNESSSKSI
jgi:hypothetical protein